MASIPVDSEFPADIRKSVQWSTYLLAKFGDLVPVAAEVYDSNYILTPIWRLVFKNYKLAPVATSVVDSNNKVSPLWVQFFQSLP